MADVSEDDSVQFKSVASIRDNWSDIAVNSFKDKVSNEWIQTISQYIVSPFRFRAVGLLG